LPNFSHGVGNSPGGFTTKAAPKVLEPYDAKVSSTVLRGKGAERLLTYLVDAINWHE